MACLNILEILEAPYMIPFSKFKYLYASDKVKSNEGSVFDEKHYLLSVKEEDLEKTFNAIDADQDGKISIAENVIAYHLESIFHSIDENKDGFLSPVELNAWGI